MFEHWILQLVALLGKVSGPLGLGLLLREVYSCALPGLYSLLPGLLHASIVMNPNKSMSQKQSSFSQVVVRQGFCHRREKITTMPNSVYLFIQTQFGQSFLDCSQRAGCWVLPSGAHSTRAYLFNDFYAGQILVPVSTFSTGCWVSWE